MATTAHLPPDPTSLTSWEDAFHHPLPVVRKLDLSLRHTISDHRQKLRSLVGASYRDLLGTAERIIAMDADIQRAETLMAQMARQCDARVVARGAEDGARVRVLGVPRGCGGGGGGRGREGFLARVKVLQGGVVAVGRVVRRGGDALCAAKVLVLARLVCKSLGGGEEGEGEGEAVVGVLARKVGVMRRRLLGYIGRVLARGEGKREDAVRALGAYALMTSSAPREVLRYYLQVRFELLEGKAEAVSEAGLVEMLDVYSRTLRDTRDIFPRRFADSLVQLSKVSLLQDADVRAVLELSLDVYELWIPDDIRNFHPWVRHDPMASSDVADAVKAWTKQAQACLLQAIRQSLAAQADAHDVLAVRHTVLSQYLSLGAELRSETHMEALDDFRAAFLDRLETLVQQAAEVPDLLEEGAQPSAEASTVPDLWSLANDDFQFNDGAVDFRRAVLARHRGQTSTLQRTTAALDEWTTRLQAFTKVITTMRATRWDNDLDLDLDDLTDGEPIQVLLSKQDPQRLEGRLQDETSKAFEDAYTRTANSPGGTADRPALGIRTLREIDRCRRTLYNDQRPASDAVKADQQFVRTLLYQLATSIAERPVHEYFQRTAAKSHSTTALWDGSPPLPLQPRPATFRFLKTLHRAMCDAGSDLWSPDAVETVKAHVVEQLAGRMAGTDHLGQPLTNGHTAKGDEAEGADESRAGDAKNQDITKQLLTQQLFDVLYLRRALASRSGRESKLDASVSMLQQQTELDAASTERLQKSAAEYWKRTYLLFGLLAS